VTSFKQLLIDPTSGLVVNELDTTSTTPDTAFRWSSTDQQWIYNLSTKGLKGGAQYTYKIALADGSAIVFSFGLK
jgi:hypothetical protein